MTLSQSATAKVKHKRHEQNSTTTTTTSRSRSNSMMMKSRCSLPATATAAASLLLMASLWGPALGQATHNAKQEEVVLSALPAHWSDLEAGDDMLQMNSPLDTPIIGILTQPYIGRNATKIASSYPKWLEMGGARSIAIPYDATPEMIADLYDIVDGVLFPGGASAVPESAKILWKMIVSDANDGNGVAHGSAASPSEHLRGTDAVSSSSYGSSVDAEASTMSPHASLPVWGTCLGFEYLLQLATNNYIDILESGFDSHNISLPLENVKKQLLYRNAITYSIVTRYNVTMNSHRQGISPKRFLDTPDLTKYWMITSTSKDRQGREFVSTIEPNDPRRFPVYGVQFHPEKNAFENGRNKADPSIPYQAIDHSARGLAAVTMEQVLYFTGIVRAHKHKRRQQRSQETLDKIDRLQQTSPWLFRPVYLYPTHPDVYFEQIYVVPLVSELEQKAPPNNDGNTASGHTATADIVAAMSYSEIIASAAQRFVDALLLVKIRAAY